MHRIASHHINIPPPPPPPHHHLLSLFNCYTSPTTTPSDLISCDVSLPHFAYICTSYTSNLYISQSLPSTMPLLSGRFGMRSRRARSSPPERDSGSLYTPRATAFTPYDHTPSRSPSPPLSEPYAPYSVPTSATTTIPFHIQELWRVLDGPRADLVACDEAFNPEMHSPNDMLVDTEEHIVEPTANGDEKDNLTIINPDNLESEAEQLQDLIRADDSRSCRPGYGS